MDVGKGDDGGPRRKSVFTINAANVTCFWFDEMGEPNLGDSIWGVGGKSHGEILVEFKHVSQNRDLPVDVNNGP